MHLPGRLQSNRTLAARKIITTSRCVAGQATVADLDGNGVNDLIVAEADCTVALQDGPRYLDVITRNANNTYNGDQTIYTSPSISGSSYPYYQFPSPATDRKSTRLTPVT